MTFRAIRAALLLAVSPIAGCGTVANLANSRPEEGGTRPFGGVKHDVACINQAADGEIGPRTRPRSESDRYPQRALIAFCAVDLPFSLVGDLVTWPFTAVYAVVNEPIPVPAVVVASPPAPAVAPVPPMPLPTPPPVPPKAESKPKPASP